MDSTTKNYLKSHYPNTQIVSSISYMETISTKQLLFNTIIIVIIIIIIPIGVAGHFPMFLYALVSEKEKQTMQMMQINGLKNFVYFSVYYLTFLLESILSSLFYLIVCSLLLDLRVMQQTNIFLILLLFLLWGHSQACLAFIFQLFNFSTKISTIFGYIFSIFIILIGANINYFIYIRPIQLPFYLNLIPQITFTRLVLIFCVECFYDHCISTLGHVNQEVLSLYLYLVFVPIIYLLISFYIENRRINYISKTKQEINYNQDQSKVLDVINIEKTYQSGIHTHKALNNVSFSIEKNEILGLLGQNGAGKTTLISILTGQISPDKGDFYITGLKGGTQMDQIYKYIGICPQFDCLWDDLTIQEHFLFYIRLRGVQKKYEEQELSWILKQMYLYEAKDKKISQLSGGMKRRVSIGISLAGQTKLIFLDEPTTGLDPINRMKIQKILKSLQQHKAILLTTHLMEEADYLCKKIVVLEQGEILEIDTPNNLKKNYGSRFHLHMKDIGKLDEVLKQLNELKIQVIEYKEMLNSVEIIINGNQSVVKEQVQKICEELGGEYYFQNATLRDVMKKIMQNRNQSQ